MGEVLNSMKFIKMYAWEQPFTDAIKGNVPARLFQAQSSAQLRLKFILLINVKMPTIVGILTFISRINQRLCHSKPSISIYLHCFGICEKFKFYAQLS